VCGIVEGTPTGGQNVTRDLVKATSRDGTEVAAYASGSGPALLVLHGTGGSWFSWEFVRPHLERDFTVYAMHRRGRGESSDGDDYSLEREGEDVAALVNAIGGAVVFGHSYGANCAMEAAVGGAAIEKLVLYEPAVQLSYPEDFLQRLDALIAEGRREEALVAAFEGFGVGPDQIEALRSTPTWNERVALAHTIARECRAERDYRADEKKLENIDVPTLFLVGSDTDPPLKEGTEKLHTAMPHSQLRVFEGHGHMAMLTAPELVAREVRTFVFDE